MAEEIIRDNMVITGDVQGVGFRYRAQYAAQALGVTGWVRNVWDGSVELEVQGTKGQINEMLLQISRGSYVQIDHIEHTLLPLDEMERSFRVRG